jgi:hypothetical protein
MHTVTVNLTTDEWIRIQQKAEKLWPGERISQAEILRRLTLAGARAILNAPQQS